MTTETLPCALTESELLARSESIAAIVEAVATLEEQKKSDAADLKKQIDDLYADMTVLARAIRTRTEYRDVSVETSTDFDRGLEVVVRADTGEIVRSRPLAPDERQGRLGLVAQ